ncbi:MAG: ABC transporter permease [Planctomycetota bacterium]|nr:MlaE family lipid ABC transporter permease subunit [Planctomycetota bacterium]MDE1888924.1 ABC transporter permease [Planctomycetota bacterium]MDE2215753.1 ABC transporter permease [Planctomycetota bacterium]
MQRNILLSIDVASKKFILSVGQATILAVKGFAGIFLPPFNLKLIFREVDNFGAGSLLLVDTIALFTGMVMALQTIYGLSMYGAEMYVGSVVSLTLVRELGPVLTSIMVGARVGSGIAAEIGSMQVTEQIDAMRALGASPIKKLVAPKILAGMITLPLLTVTADIIGIFGGMIIALFELEIDHVFYINSVLTTIKISDLLSGIGKTVFFGFLIAVLGCYFGLRTTGGTTGVGRSTTITVVTISILILISDFFLTKLFLIVF